MFMLHCHKSGTIQHLQFLSHQMQGCGLSRGTAPVFMTKGTYSANDHALEMTRIHNLQFSRKYLHRTCLTVCTIINQPHLTPHFLR